MLSHEFVLIARHIAQKNWLDAWVRVESTLEKSLYGAGKGGGGLLSLYPYFNKKVWKLQSGTLIGKYYGLHK